MIDIGVHVAKSAKSEALVIYKRMQVAAISNGIW